MSATARKAGRQRERAELKLYRTKGIEVYTTRQTCVEGDNCTIEVDIDPNDHVPGRAHVSMGSYGITFAGRSVKGLRPAVMFDCDTGLLKALAEAFAEAYAASAIER
jgi:hypothetical protein